MFTVFSYGAGQDSKGILTKLVEHPYVRKTYVQGDMLVIMGNTRDEHEETYQDLNEVQAMCQKAGFHWVFLDSSMGFHSKAWPGLREFYRSKNTVGSKAFPKSCTMQLKITPIYRYLEKCIEHRYGIKADKKKAFYEYKERFGKLRVILGIAADEDRVADEKDLPKWMRECIERVYPLRDWGMTRKDCQEYIKHYGYNVPPPSNCKLCPYLSEVELLWLYRFDRASYDEWVQLEKNKLEKNRHMDQVLVEYKNKKGIVTRSRYENRNFGVWGDKTLPEKLLEAMEKYGHWSDDELKEYKFSHGHCVRSKY